MNTGTFQYNGATITVQKPTVATRVRLWQLRQALSEQGTGNVPQDVADTLCFYLANTVKVEGSLSFPVPLDAPTHDQLIAFLEGFAGEDETLLTQWDNAIYRLKVATNDPDLLPPHEVDQKKEKAPPSSSKG